MSTKLVEVEGIGTVNLYKRRSSRSIRISITHSGQVRVSMPLWAPYSAGLKFLESRKEWIISERPTSTLLTQGYSLGKAHHISFNAGTGSTVTTRVAGNEAKIMLPTGVRWDSQVAQDAAKSCAIRVLKKEARMLLPKRLELLASQHHFEYNSVTVKQLSGRWGSCSQQKDIVLNCFLMQLPWELIDYVIFHELTHTKVMAHGPVFWDAMERVLPDVQRRRKQMKTYKPVL